MDDTQSALLSQFDHAPGQIFIADAASELPVEDVGGQLAKRVGVDVLNDTMQLLRLEQSAPSPHRRSV